MRTIARQLTATLLFAFAIGYGMVAHAVPFEELSGRRRALYTARAVAANTLPGASSLTEPKCLPGYIMCKFVFAAFSVVAAGESLVLSGGSDLPQAKSVLYRGFSGDWVVTPRDIAGDTKPELLPEAPPPAEGEEQKGPSDFKPPPL